MKKSYLNTVEQVINESDYDVDQVKNIIKSKELPDYTELMEKAKIVILNHVTGNYYNSKNNRLTTFKYNNPELFKIVEELFIDVIIATANGNTKIQTVVGMLAPKLKLKTYDSLVTASELITIVSEVDFYDVMITDDGVLIDCKYVMNTETIKSINKLKYLPPMLVKPNNWNKNKGGGWLNSKRSLILSGKHHDNWVDLYSINILQSIEWKLDNYILDNCIEKPKKDSNIANFKRENAKAQIVYEEYRSKPFYFVWRYDSRGRMYSQGYHINLQGTSYKKALLNFADEQLITGE